MKMNLDSFILASVGQESFLNTPETMIENEAKEDLAIENEIEVAQESMYMAGLESVAADVNSFRAMLAERETNLAVNNGREASAVYSEFGIGVESVGMEAITDVAARHAYAGIASLKSLINKVISWLKNLLGFGTTIKKIASSLKLKAKNEIKALGKYSGKDMSKLKRTMPKETTLQAVDAKDGADFETLDKTVTALVGVVVKSTANTAGSIALEKAYQHGELKKAIEAAKVKKEELGEALKDWKDDNDEYEESAAYSHVVKLVQGVQKWATDNSADKSDKTLAKAIKNMEKVREEVVKKAAETKDKDPDKDFYRALPKTLEYIVRFLNESQGVQRAQIKVVIGQADEILTHSKAIQAAL